MYSFRLKPAGSPPSGSIETRSAQADNAKAVCHDYAHYFP